MKNMFTSTNKFAWSYIGIIFPVGFASQGILDKYPRVCIDGARPPKMCLQFFKKNGLDEKQQSCYWLWIKDPSYMIDYNNFEKIYLLFNPKIALCNEWFQWSY